MRKQVSEFKANTSEYKKEFTQANYCRISVTIPKEQEAAVKAHAASKGQSVNSLINELLRADMGLTEYQWTKKVKKSPMPHYLSDWLYHTSVDAWVYILHNPEYAKTLAGEFKTINKLIEDFVEGPSIRHKPCGSEEEREEQVQAIYNLLDALAEKILTEKNKQ